MANIVVSFRNFLQDDNFNKLTFNPDILPPFYESFLMGLKNKGNNILCFQAKSINIERKIPPLYLKQIEDFRPDLFIFFNNYFWDIHKLFEQPIIIYDVDSPNAYSHLDILKDNKDRFKYLVNQSDGIKITTDVIGCKETYVEYIPPFTEIKAHKLLSDINIAFVGANWLWNNWMPIINFINENPSDKDRKTAQEVLQYLLEHPTKTSNEIYNELDLEAYKKVNLNNKFFDITRLSGIKRLRYLTAVADLGLEIRGKYWQLKDNTLVSYPEVLLCCSNKTINNIKTTENFFNRAKIGLNTKHIQAKSGFSWRVCDILASNACLVSEKADDIQKLGFKIPTFESPAECREQCLKILNNENMRLDIVSHSQEIINKRHRFEHILPTIEDFIGVSLTSSQEGTLKFIPIIEEKKAPTKLISTNQTPNNKFSIKFANIPLYKIKRKNINESNIYVLGVPLFKMLQNSKGYNFNLLFLSNLYRLYAKQKDKLKQFKIQRQNIKSKQEICQKFKDGKKINICIQVSRPGMWCFDYLYKLLEKDPRFNVSILIMPDHNYKREIHQFYLEKTYKELCQKGYKPIKGYDFDIEKSVDIRGVINPDIIFYTDFWKPHFYDRYYITSFLDKITFLNEYGFSVMQDELTCNFELNNLVDIYFRPTEIHKQMAQQLMKNKGRNVIVTGSPKLDALFDAKYKPIDVWKKQKGQIHKKRIIWAPHYTDKMPDNMYKNDAFWEIYDFMLEIANKYEDKVQFVFRPHPVLKKRASERWGEEEQEAYYHKWDTLSNGQYYDGDFVDLFMKSDAMLTDSCSFRAEYTAFNKPLFITKTQTSRSNYNDFGQKLNELFYIPSSDLKQGIIDFIEDVVLRGNDYKKAERTEFVKKYFGKINGKTASENIYNEIIKFLEKGKIA